jgi:hypothetical protein
MRSYIKKKKKSLEIEIVYTKIKNFNMKIYFLLHLLYVLIWGGGCN